MADLEFPAPPPPPPSSQELLSELQRLPSAREIPSCLGQKRERVTGVLRPAAAAPNDSRASHSADPTAALLSQAASQLHSMVKLQMQRRRLLRAVRQGERRWGTGAADDGSDADDESLSDSASEDDGDSRTRGGPHARPSPHHVCLLTALGAADTASVSVESLSLGSSQNNSWRRRAGAQIEQSKRSCLERSFALDLDERCPPSGERLPARAE